MIKLKSGDKLRVIDDSDLRRDIPFKDGDIVEFVSYGILKGLIVIKPSTGIISNCGYSIERFEKINTYAKQYR